MMRSRPDLGFPRSALNAQSGNPTGIVGNTAFAKVPDRRCTASHALALHRVRDTCGLTWRHQRK